MKALGKKANHKCQICQQVVLKGNRIIMEEEGEKIYLHAKNCSKIFFDESQWIFIGLGNGLNIVL